MNATTLSDAAEREAALDLNSHVLVMAPAGSGKTGLLVTRMLRALCTAEEPEQVVAITFTNKAAAEIRARVLELIHAAASDNLGEVPASAAAAARALVAHSAARDWNLLHQPERIRALTIDSFNSQIASQLPLLSGMGGSVRVGDDPWALYSEAVTRLFAELEEDALADEDREAMQMVLRLANNRIDQVLPPLINLLSAREQWIGRISRGDQAHWDAIESDQLASLAEQGMQHLLEALGAEHAEEVSSLLREGSSVCEQLSWAFDLDSWPEPAIENLPLYRKLVGILITDKGTIRSSRGINTNHGFAPKLSHTKRMKEVLEARSDDATLASAASAVLQLPDGDYPETLKTYQRALLRTVHRLAGHLRVVFSESGTTDFAQIALSALSALRPHGDVYGEALLAADRRIRHLLVDEMQDTSESQVELLRQITAGWEPGDGRSIFLVGDPQQSIYAFRKAEVSLFLQLWTSGQLGDLDLTTLRLRANFRSSSVVVDWFNSAFSAIFPDEMDLTRGAVQFSPSDPHRPAGDGRVSVAQFAPNDEDAAAEAAATDAAQLCTSGSVVVLARMRSHLPAVLRALRARGLTPSCQDIDPLSAQPAVRDYVSLVRAVWHPADRLHWAAVLRAPFIGLSWADMVALSVGRNKLSWPERIAKSDQCALSADGAARLAKLNAVLESTGADYSLRANLADRAEAIWHGLGASSCIDSSELADVMGAMRLVRRFSRNGTIEDIQALERGLEKLYAEPRAGQVQVMTVHKAKGLEFDHVLLVGCNRRPRNEDRPLWHFKRIGDEELLVPRPPDAFDEKDASHRLYDYLHERHVTERSNEALRLLYVAATRAKRTLTLYVCAGADSNGRIGLEPGSFARLLAPVLQLQAAPTGTIAPEIAQEPLDPFRSLACAPRLPPTVVSRLDAVDLTTYRPQEQRMLKPSESVMNAVDGKREQRAEAKGDLYAQLVGTMYHHALERVAIEGVAAWDTSLEARSGAMASGFRRMGLPEPLVLDAVSRTILMVERTLKGAHARWLLDTRDWARNEYHLAGFLDGKWISAVIDRCFTDDDDTLWVIDYKSAAYPHDVASWDNLVNNGVSKYAEQIRMYTRLMRELRPGRTVRGALFFAEADRIVEVI